jgi:hypothetical protein
MPVSKNRKGHAKKALQRKTEMIQYRNRMNNMYKQMYETLREKSTSMTDMLNKEEQELKDLNNPDLYKSDTASFSEQIIDGKPCTVVTLPERDPNEPVSIVSQWPADMQMPEIEQKTITSSR